MAPVPQAGRKEGRQMRMIVFAVYVAIGAMLHALIIGSAFDWSSAWTFAWVLGWPIMLVVTFSTVILIGGTIFCAVYVTWEWLKSIATWRVNRIKGRNAK